MDTPLSPCSYRLPQHECAATRTSRARRLAATRHAHRWIREPELPPHPEQVDARHQLSEPSQRYIRWQLRRAALNRVLGLAAGRAQPWSLAAFERLGPLIEVPTQTRRRWREDRLLAWSLVAGVNPMQLELCEELPTDLGVRDEHLRGLLPAGLELGALIARQRIFLADFSAVAGLECLPGRYLAAPRLLLWRDDEGQLQPLAITLRPAASRGRRRPPPVFTPLDGEWDWLGARAYLQNASNHTHQAIHHLMETHLIAEVACIGMHRNLAPEHPLYALLEPHLRECVGINEEARGLLLGAGGLVDRSMSAGGRGLVTLIRRAWPSWRWRARTLEADLAGRGLASREVLPEFPYREDARAVHGALRRYVAGFVGEVYREDAEVAQDPELQAWLRELGDPDGGTIGGLPQLRDIEALVDFLAELLFKLTAQHGAMQHGQKQAYGFAPFCPAGLYAPAPEGHGASAASFLDMLPDRAHALSQLASAHILARPVERPLINFGEHETRGPLARARAGLRGELRSVSALIRARNVQRWLPYEALDPAHLSTCVDI